MHGDSPSRSAAKAAFPSLKSLFSPKSESKAAAATTAALAAAAAAPATANRVRPPFRACLYRSADRPPPGFGGQGCKRKSTEIDDEAASRALRCGPTLSRKPACGRWVGTHAGLTVAGRGGRSKDGKRVANDLENCPVRGCWSGGVYAANRERRVIADWRSEGLTDGRGLPAPRAPAHGRLTSGQGVQLCRGCVGCIRAYSSNVACSTASPRTPLLALTPSPAVLIAARAQVHLLAYMLPDDDAYARGSPLNKRAPLSPASGNQSNIKANLGAGTYSVRPLQKKKKKSTFRHNTVEANNGFARIGETALASQLIARVNSLVTLRRRARARRRCHPRAEPCALASSSPLTPTRR